MSFAPLSAPAPLGAEGVPPEGMEYSKRKWISPLQLWMHSLMAETLWVAMVAVLILDISGIVVRAIGYSILQKWSVNHAVISLSTTPPIAGLQADLLVTIAYLIMLMALSIDILLSLSLSSRDFEQGVVRTYTIVVVFHIPIMLGYVVYECSAQTAAFLLAACQVTSTSTDCPSFVQRTKLASLVPTTLSIVLHLLGCIFAWHFVQKEAIRKDRVAHRHLERLKSSSSSSMKTYLKKGGGMRYGGRGGGPSLSSSFQSQPQTPSQGYGYPPGLHPNQGGMNYSSDTDSDDAKRMPLPPPGSGGLAQRPAWLVPSEPGNPSRTTVSSSGPPTQQPVSFPPPPPHANALGRSRSERRGSMSMRSLEKGSTTTGHARSGSIAEYNRELEESDDEVDALVGDGEHEGGRED